MTTALLLIPGFFGFGRFVQTDGTRLDYFAGVEDVITRARDDLRGRIVVHEPPPTGSLNERIASLHDAVVNILTGSPLPHKLTVKAERVHLIGHSTGGVDARLYARPEFRWAGGPRPADRAELLRGVGDVVTLSAPFRGTPIAKFARTERDVFLMAVYALTILGGSNIGSEVLASIVKSLLRGTNRGDQLSTVSASLDFKRRDWGDQFVDELLDFFMLIVEDRQLLRDLTVESMSVLNGKLTGDDHPRIRSYVSLSPAPKRFFSVSGIADFLSDLSEPFQRALYSHLYADTSAEALPNAAIPKVVEGGLRLGARLDEHLNVERANDGVVPISSQTLDGKAAGIVLGDHLDVTGHFGGSSQGNVFKTDANFTRMDLETLWTHIARGLPAD